MKWFEMKVAGVGADATNKTPLLILRTMDNKTSVGIWIGFNDAATLLPLIEGKTFSRPHAHQVFGTFLTQMDAVLDRVEIIDMVDNIYYAKMVLDTPKGSIELDSRPSDAISMALRNQAPIYMSVKALEKSFAGESLPTMEDTSDKGKELAHYLHNLPGELFGKPV